MQWHRNQHLKSQNDMLRGELAHCKRMAMALAAISIILGFMLGVYEWTA